MLTPKRHRLLKYITDYVDGHGYSPTSIEMKHEVGGAIYFLLAQLVEEGYLEARGARKTHRRYFPTDQARELPALSGRHQSTDN